MGLTAGISSALSAYWVRQRISRLLHGSGALESIYGRVRRRSKFGLAALAFTGCATVVSGSIDSIEDQLGYQHRSVGHSIPIFGGVWTTARLALRAGRKAVDWVSERVNYSRNLDPIVDELENLARWALDSGITGFTSHILGDIPTKGHSGFAALKALYPLSNRSITLKLITSRALDKIGVGVGAFLAGSSWAIIGAHMVSAELPELSVRAVLSSVASLGWNLVTKGVDVLYEGATRGIAQFENVLCDAYSTRGSGVRVLAHRFRVTCQNFFPNFGYEPYPTGNPQV